MLDVMFKHTIVGLYMHPSTLNTLYTHLTGTDVTHAMHTHHARTGCDRNAQFRYG